MKKIWDRYHHYKKHPCADKEISPEVKEKYDYIGKCRENFIRVKNGVPPKKLKCGYLDENFNEVIPLIYTGIKNFSEGLAAVKIGNWANGKWGFINTKGELVIPYLFDRTFPFLNGHAKVVLNGRWCFINTEGKVVVDVNKYDGSTSYYAGFIGVIIKQKINHYSYKWFYTIIDKLGNELLPITEGFVPSGYDFKEGAENEDSKYYKYNHNLITIEEFRQLKW